MPFSLCNKCRYCRYSVKLSVNTYIEEWRHGETFIACYYAGINNALRPCKAGPECTSFRMKRKEYFPFKKFVNVGLAHYSWYQVHKKEKPGFDYKPSPGDIAIFIGGGGVFYRFFVHRADDKNFWVWKALYNTKPHLQRYALDCMVLVGFITPPPNMEDTMMRVKHIQEKFGLTPSGVFDADTQEKFLELFESDDVDIDEIMQMYTVCLGYDYNQIDKFQKVEELEVTGTVTPETIERAKLYIQR